MATNQNENNIGIDIIEGGIARFGVAAIGTIKTGIGFGLKHTGNGIVWAGRHVQDAGSSLQISGLKDKYSVAISAIAAGNTDKATKEKQLAEVTKSAFEKIAEIAGEAGEQIETYSNGKQEILTKLADAKGAVKLAQTAISEIIADCQVEAQAVEQQAQPAAKQAQPMPKTTAAQPNRNLDEEAFADC